MAGAPLPIATPFIICRLRGLPVAATPEEQVRQRVVDTLLAQGYPWHLWRCEVGHPQWGRQMGRADLVFGLEAASGFARAAAIIEVKAHPPREVDLEQAAGYAQAFSAPLFAVTDGVTWEVRQRDNTTWLPRPTFPAFHNWVNLALSMSP